MRRSFATGTTMTGFAPATPTLTGWYSNLTELHGQILVEGRRPLLSHVRSLPEPDAPDGICTRNPPLDRRTLSY